MARSMREMRGFQDTSELVESFKSVFERMGPGADFGSLIDEVYSKDLLFEDCFHRIEGSEQFKQYCQEMYANVINSEFEFHQQWVGTEDAMVNWTLNYSHRFLKRGKSIKVEGATMIRFQGELAHNGDLCIVHHRDYVDGGSMLYEHLPLFGPVIKQLKKRML